MKFEIAHICLRVLNLEKSIEFYRTALGFREVRRKDFPEAGFTLVFMADEDDKNQVELTYNYDRQTPYEIGDGYSHLGVFTDDLEGALDFHRKNGYEVTDIKGLPGSPGKFYFLTDPDGYKVEVIRK
ncbi:lactoylglutathione lyase [Alkalibacter mobilis]|uniref:lactoylglutathione lyase n=1 Tax=Alkalibacter mobilis TaxID=2787712 RepID=UPI00189DD507|nr:VOC family protein [Alkalibacter mobilis]MBF7096551.1 VOC family protein [Alkalibacter mobilis]